MSMKKRALFRRVPAFFILSAVFLFGAAGAAQGFSFNGGVSYWDDLCWVGFTAAAELTEDLTVRGSFYYTTNGVSRYRAAADFLYNINLFPDPGLSGVFAPYTGGGVSLSSQKATNMHILAGIKIKTIDGYFRAEVVYTVFPKGKNPVGVNLDFSWHVINMIL